jgi:hypothetical protein
MGEFLNIVLIVLGISVLGGLVSIAMTNLALATGTSGTVPIFLGDYLFGNGQSHNPLTGQITGSNEFMVYNDVNESSLPSQSTLGTTTGGIVPDWLNSAKNWVTGAVNGIGTTTRVVVNIMGFPYTLMVAMNFPAPISALVGGAFCIIFFILLVMFILGRVS